LSLRASNNVSFSMRRYGGVVSIRRYENQVLREFSINLLYYLSAADTGVARTIATSDLAIGLLLGFIEQAEQNAMVIAQKHGVNALRDNPDSMGTSLDMMRRAASTLSNLSRHPDNIALYMRHEQRLLDLVMSQILDQGVASILSHVLFNIGIHSNERMKKTTTAYTENNPIANPGKADIAAS
jgi:AT-rich interactive domain-containing protein 1